jgi:hypothetical protein
VAHGIQRALPNRFQRQYVCDGDQHITFSGGVTNIGTISTKGISVISGAFLSGGGILDTGTIVGGIKVDSSSKIVASGGSTQTAIAMENTGIFVGGISNAGRLSAVHNGLLVGTTSGLQVLVFSGGVRNRGTIAAGSHAITVSNAAACTGGITNSGHISGGSTSCPAFSAASTIAVR